MVFNRVRAEQPLDFDYGQELTAERWKMPGMAKAECDWRQRQLPADEASENGEVSERRDSRKQERLSKVEYSRKQETATNVHYRTTPDQYKNDQYITNPET